MSQKIMSLRFTGEEEVELYEFLRQESFDTGLPMAEILRRGLELYKTKKEMETMKKIEIVIIEAGLDYTERLEKFEADSPISVTDAIKLAEAKGYTVIPNHEGGQNELCTVTGGQDYIAITVAPTEVDGW